MKKTIIALAMASILPMGAFAAEDASPHKQGHKRGGPQPMYEQLELTETQKTQVKEIMKAQHQETEAKIAAVLTPEQSEKLKNIKAEQKAKWEARKEAKGDKDSKPLE